MVTGRQCASRFAGRIAGSEQRLRRFPCFQIPLFGDRSPEFGLVYLHRQDIRTRRAIRIRSGYRPRVPIVRCSVDSILHGIRRRFASDPKHFPPRCRRRGTYGLRRLEMSQSRPGKRSRYRRPSIALRTQGLPWCIHRARVAGRSSVPS